MAQSKTAGHITYSAVRGIKILKYILLRLFRGAVRLPEEIIDEMLKAFLHTQDAAIKVQAYGRGLLQRFRSHRLITKDFNRQASREYQEYLTAWQGFNNPAGYLDDMRHPFLHGYRFARDHELDISQDYDGIRAIFETRAHRMTRKRGQHGTISPWLAGRFTRFVKSRLYWRAHRSRLGVKLLDFGAG